MVKQTDIHWHNL